MSPRAPTPKQAASVAVSHAHPLYELRLKARTRTDWRLEIWQLPSPATPRLRVPERVATIKGKPLRLVEAGVLKRLSRAGISWSAITPGKERAWPLEEDTALTLGLLFRVLAPMGHIDRIRQVAEGVGAMNREEAGYWLGMAMHRKFPRRV
ncbi:MAG: hypothetical protein M1457_11730, partial [bacterium]|nr:hypothetical protein [bacterium]